MAQGKETAPQAESESDLYFGPFRLERAKRLWRGNQLLEVRPRPLAVLRYLAGRPGRLVTGEELLKRLWPGIYVTKTVLRVCVREIRQALQEDSTTPQFIETVGRQGYRFIAPLTATPPGVSSQYPVASRLQPQPPYQQVTTENWQLTTHFVGRKQELLFLHDMFERAQRGERQIVFVLGEPGIGKTTLVDRFLDQVQSTGPVWIGRGQCVEQHGPGEASLPVLEAFGQLCREPGGKDVMATLRHYAPMWLGQMAGLAEAGKVDTVQPQVQGRGQEYLLRELAEAVEALAAKAVVVLVFEDLQWSDTSTLEVLAYLAQRRRQVQLYILGTYRPTEVAASGHPLRRLVQELYGRRQCEELALELFTEEEVDEYLNRRFSRSAAVTALRETVYSRTDGNALFMVHFVDYLIERKFLVEADGQWGLRVESSVLKELVPDTLQQLILQQIERLNSEEQQLLGVASVVGMAFTAAEIAELVGRTVEEAEEVCDTLVTAGRLIAAAGVVEWPDGTVGAQYGFRHALYRQVLYQQLGQARRVRLHRQVAEQKVMVLLRAE